MFSIKKLYPLKTSDLVRVGRNRDGGYVINRRVIDNSQNLISLGVSIDWSFEEDFKSRTKNINIFAFDFSVGLEEYYKMASKSILNIFKSKEYASRKTLKEKFKLTLYPLLYLKTAFSFSSFFKPSKKNYFFQKGIDSSTHDCFITLQQMFEKIEKITKLKKDSVFLKMDIELSEYDVLPQLNPYINLINSMAIEFHKVEKNWDKLNAILDNLMQFYFVTHLHGNNFTEYIRDTKTPDCFEITLTKKTLFSKEEAEVQNINSYPIKGLDYPCFDELADMELSFN